jgi:hypothetical protein
MDEITFVTIWERFDSKKKIFIFNHIEDGVKETEKPKVISTKCGTSQKSWQNYTWRKTFAKMQNNKI